MPDRQCHDDGAGRIRGSSSGDRSSPRAMRRCRTMLAASTPGARTEVQVLPLRLFALRCSSSRPSGSSPSTRCRTAGSRIELAGRSTPVTADPWMIWVALVGAVLVAIAGFRAYFSRARTPKPRDQREVDRPSRPADLGPEPHSTAKVPLDSRRPPANTDRGKPRTRSQWRPRWQRSIAAGSFEPARRKEVCDG